MWLMDERQKLADLQKIVTISMKRLEAVETWEADARLQLTRMKETIIVIEARLERLETSPSIRARRAIPHGTPAELNAPAVRGPQDGAR